MNQRVKQSAEFESFDSISRLNREVSVTEKIDGANASVRIAEMNVDILPNGPHIAVIGQHFIYAGSRNRFITPEDDNFGFARRVKENAERLVTLGSGTHFGEWWGAGIQRRYGLQEKRFSLFNRSRWHEEAVERTACHVVPELASGHLLELDFRAIADRLRIGGSVAAPGFMNPEGFVVFHSASRSLFKYTLDKNDEHKGQATKSGES